VTFVRLELSLLADPASRLFARNRGRRYTTRKHALKTLWLSLTPLERPPIRVLPCSVRTTRLSLSVGPLANNTVMKGEVARAEAKIGAIRYYLIDTVTETYRRAAASRLSTFWTAPARRLQCHNERRRGRRLPNRGPRCRRDLFGQPFEHRFRDIHTVAQQNQSHDANYETVGRVLLGNPPEVFL
jgi:hypothetical protein